MSESFIHELSLEVFEEEIATLDIRFMAGGSLYNGCLQECFRRLLLMRESKVNFLREIPKEISYLKKL